MQNIIYKPRLLDINRYTNTIQLLFIVNPSRFLFTILHKELLTEAASNIYTEIRTIINIIIFKIISTFTEQTVQTIDYSYLSYILYIIFSSTVRSYALAIF